MKPEDAKMIEALHAYVVEASRAGASYDAFWDGFCEIEGDDFSKRALADDAEPELTEQYCEVMASADDAGYMVPPEHC